jgi:hypothetical protein
MLHSFLHTSVLFGNNENSKCRGIQKTRDISDDTFSQMMRQTNKYFSFSLRLKNSNGYPDIRVPHLQDSQPSHY